jgi:hypothetical protein
LVFQKSSYRWDAGGDGEYIVKIMATASHASIILDDLARPRQLALSSYTLFCASLREQAANVKGLRRELREGCPLPPSAVDNEELE